MQQYTFPHVAIEIMITLSNGSKSPELMVKQSGRNMLAILKSLEELMSDNFLYKLPDSTFSLTKIGRSFIEELNVGLVFGQTSQEDVFDLRW